MHSVEPMFLRVPVDQPVKHWCASRVVMKSPTIINSMTQTMIVIALRTMFTELTTLSTTTTLTLGHKCGRIDQSRSQHEMKELLGRDPM